MDNKFAEEIVKLKEFCLNMTKKLDDPGMQVELKLGYHSE